MNAEVTTAFRSLMPNGNKPHGRMFQMLDPRSWFEPAREKAGIKDLHWHDLRHTFCSRLAMAGVPLKTIQTRWAQDNLSHGKVSTPCSQHLALRGGADYARIQGQKPGTNSHLYSHQAKKSQAGCGVKAADSVYKCIVF